MTAKKQFKTIFYVVQTRPILKTCGYTFDSKVANKMAWKIKQLTGVRGKVIEFSRDELSALFVNN
jgi:hypothetical protein